MQRDVPRFRELSDFLSFIESKGQLRRIREKVSVIHEVTEIHRRVIVDQGPALLFEQPIKADGTPSNMPLLTNLFGTIERTAWGLGIKPDRLEELARGNDVVVLCEGDPFFYGSFMHLYSRLQGRAELDVVAGIPGMAGCWNVVGQPIALGDDVMTVLMGTLPEAELHRRVNNEDALVIMKTGRNIEKIRRALQVAGRLDEAWLIERGTMPGERVARLGEQPLALLPVGHGRLRAQGHGDGPGDTRPAGPGEHVVRVLPGPVVLAQGDGGQGSGPPPGHEPRVIHVEARAQELPR